VGIARENGYASWPALVHARQASAERLIVAATSGRRDRAEAMLAARPELEPRFIDTAQGPLLDWLEDLI
jgi:hypothetical protein